MDTGGSYTLPHSSSFQANRTSLELAVTPSLPRRDSCGYAAAEGPSADILRAIPVVVFVLFLLYKMLFLSTNLCHSLNSFFVSLAAVHRTSGVTVLPASFSLMTGPITRSSCWALLNSLGLMASESWLWIVTVSGAVKLHQLLPKLHLLAWTSCCPPRLLGWHFVTDPL